MLPQVDLHCYNAAFPLQVRKDYVEDPLNVVANIRARTANSILQGQRKLKPHYKDFTLPVYGYIGSSDRCCSMPALKKFIDEIQSADKQLNVVEGGYHELLMGPQKNEVVQNVIDWVLAHLTSPTQEPEELRAPLQTSQL